MIENNNIEYITSISHPLLLLFSDHFALYNQSPYINDLSNLFFLILTQMELPSSLLYSYLSTFSELISSFSEKTILPSVFLTIPDYIVPKLIQYCSSSYLDPNDTEYNHIRMISQDIILDFSDGYVGAERISTIIVKTFIKQELNADEREACMFLYRGVIDCVIASSSILFEQVEEKANDTFDMSITFDESTTDHDHQNQKEIVPIETCIDHDLNLLLDHLQYILASEICLKTSLSTLLQFNDWFRCRPVICQRVLDFLLNCLSNQLYVNTVIPFVKQYLSELGFLTQSQYEQLLNLMNLMQSSLSKDMFLLYLKSITQGACIYIQNTNESTMVYIQQIITYFLQPLFSLIQSEHQGVFTVENTPSLSSLLLNMNYISSCLSGIMNIRIANSVLVNMYEQIDSLYNHIDLSVLLPYMCNFYKAIISLIPLENIDMKVNVSIYHRIFSLLSIYDDIEIYKILYIYLTWYATGLDFQTLNDLSQLLLLKIDRLFEQQTVDINILTQIYHCIYHILLHPECEISMVPTLYPYIIRSLNDNMIEYYFQKNLLKLLKLFFIVYIYSLFL